MQSFTTTYQDHRHAQKASNQVIESAADADAVYQAGRAMLASDGQMAGVRAYCATLESLASEDTRTLARAAYDASLAASQKHRDDQAAAESLAAEDQDESYGEPGDHSTV
jgi:fructose-specific component phosphotransferase system IIB-like protein